MRNMMAAQQQPQAMMMQQGGLPPVAPPVAVAIPVSQDMSREGLATNKTDEASAPPQGGGESLSEEIQKLAQLHQQGILSAEEFAEAKKRLISS